MIAVGQIREHESRCQPHLLRLRTLASAEAGAGLSRQATAEVRQATNAVIVEAEAAGDAALTAVAASRKPGAETFLLVRLNRLAAAADEAVSAAHSGDGPQLRRQLHRFDALVSAIWTVEHAVYASGRSRPACESAPLAVTR
jgi:hypothetical protein